MTQAEVAQAVRDALRAAQWARRHGWRPIVALYLDTAARWRGTLQIMRDTGMAVLPPF